MVTSLVQYNDFLNHLGAKHLMRLDINQLVALITIVQS